MAGISPRGKNGKKKIKGEKKRVKVSSAEARGARNGIFKRSLQTIVQQFL